MGMYLFFSGFTPRRLLPFDIWTLTAFDAECKTATGIVIECMQCGFFWQNACVNSMKVRNPVLPF